MWVPWCPQPGDRLEGDTLDRQRAPALGSTGRALAGGGQGWKGGRGRQRRGDTATPAAELYLLGGHRESWALPPGTRRPWDPARAGRKQLHSLGRWPFRSGSPQHTASPGARGGPGPRRACVPTARHRARCPGGSPGPPAGGRAGAGALRGKAAVGAGRARRPRRPGPSAPPLCFTAPLWPLRTGFSWAVNMAPVLYPPATSGPPASQMLSDSPCPLPVALEPASPRTRGTEAGPTSTACRPAPRPLSTCPSFSSPSSRLPVPPPPQPCQPLAESPVLTLGVF